MVQQRKVVYKYNIESNYDYVSVNILENYNDLIEAVENGSKKKWMIFVDSIVYGKQLEKTLKDKLECDSIIFITTDYKKDVDGIREVDEISRESMFSKRILITTAVLDNGVNIKDLELQNIVVCADTEEQFIQMLGRKRKDGINTNLYIFKRDKVHFQRRLAMVEKVRKIAINYMKTFEKWLNGDEKYYISKEGWLIQEQHCQIMKKMAENELDYKDVMKVFWVYGGILMLNLLAYHHLEILCSYYQRIIECFSTYGDNAFLQEQLKWLGKNQKETDEVINGCMKSRLDEARENVIDAMEQNKEKEMTKEERHLWYDFLRSYPVRFSRQKVLGKYIADFYCAEAKLVIELDGSQHYEDRNIKKDADRTAFLEGYGLRVIRIPNNDVGRNFCGVCEYIDAAVKQSLSQLR